MKMVVSEIKERPVYSWDEMRLMVNRAFKPSHIPNDTAVFVPNVKGDVVLIGRLGNESFISNVLKETFSGYKFIQVKDFTITLNF